MLIVGIPKSDFGPSPETDLAPSAAGVLTINGERCEYQLSPAQGFWFRPPGTAVWDKRQILSAVVTDDDIVVFHCSNAVGEPTMPITMFRPGADGRIVKTTIGPRSN
jgi:hypothetical protein